MENEYLEIKNKLADLSPRIEISSMTKNDEQFFLKMNQNSK